MFEIASPECLLEMLQKAFIDFYCIIENCIIVELRIVIVIVYFNAIYIIFILFFICTK